MQNSTSNPSRNPSSSSTGPSLSPDVLARAYERAVRRMRSAAPSFAELLGSLAAQPDEPTPPRGPAAPHAPVAQPADDAPDEDTPDESGEPARSARVTLDELLPVFRAPIEWAFARAERYADGDSLDLAALGRIRAAYESRLAWTMSGGTFGAARPHVRPTDLITVAGLVIGSIDPGFAERTSTGLRESFFDALAGALPIGMASLPVTTSAPQPAGPVWYGAAFSGAPLRFGAPHIPCPAMPMCCCRHGHGL